MAPQMSPAARRALARVNELAYRLSRREKPIKQRLDYLNGNHQLCYASPEFRDYFAGRFDGFSDNWCAPVINGPVERMNPLGVRLDTGSREVDQDLARAWRANDGEARSSEAFTVTTAAGWSFAQVWGNPDDEDTPLINWQRPDQAIVERDPETRRRRDGMILWRDETKEYATYDDGEFLWKFQRHSFVYPETRSLLVLPNMAQGGWEMRHPESDDVWPLPNPMGEVSIVELPNYSLMDDNPVSDIAGVMAMQDAINLVWAYLMNALDYASLPQRIMTGAEMPQVPVLDEDGQIIGRKPVDLNSLLRERILWVPGKDAKPGEWSSANLEVFSKVIEQAIEHIAAQTRTPPHYLIGKVANLSAEALTAAETGLVAKTRQRIAYLQPGIREINRLVALAMGDEAKAKAVRNGTVVWADVQYRSDGVKVDALVKLRQMGFPFEWIAEQYGLDPLEVKRVIEMREKELADPMWQQIMASAKATISTKPGDVTGMPDVTPPAPQPDVAPVVG